MRALAAISPQRAAMLFAVANLAFLGIDIALAHRANDFARRVEWAPVVFSAVATLLLLPAAVGLTHRAVQIIDRCVGGASVAVGVAGMIFHLQSGFLAEQTLHNLVYSAPFVAPLSYVGVGLIVLLLGSEDARGPSFGPWLLVLALGGFLGNFALSLLDHAQNGFFHATEWIPVASAALAVGFLVVQLGRPGEVPRRLFFSVMGLQAVVGVLGVVLHGIADLHDRSAASTIDRLVFGAPPFAPMLFADLAVLAAIGVWAGESAPFILGTLALRSDSVSSSSEVPPPPPAPAP